MERRLKKDISILRWEIVGVGERVMGRVALCPVAVAISAGSQQKEFCNLHASLPSPPTVVQWGEISVLGLEGEHCLSHPSTGNV